MRQHRHLELLGAESSTWVYVCMMPMLRATSAKVSSASRMVAAVLNADMS